ncbi:hypothetical protein TcWFU_007393 [Taenia crassiceps]|uniref:Uncharacterized protein n=1 Tax=Taenia crassiceps TaxID=6207 RepID=A0ABR4QKP4_9CEST
MAATRLSLTVEASVFARRKELKEGRKTCHLLMQSDTRTPQRLQPSLVISLVRRSTCIGTYNSPQRILPQGDPPPLRIASPHNVKSPRSTAHLRPSWNRNCNGCAAAGRSHVRTHTHPPRLSASCGDTWTCDWAMRDVVAKTA